MPSDSKDKSVDEETYRPSDDLLLIGIYQSRQTSQMIKNHSLIYASTIHTILESTQKQLY